MAVVTSESEPAAVAATVWRAEAVRLVAGLTRLTSDLSLAEDLAQDALVAALEQWPSDGVPANPGAWLMAVARRRAVDHFRRSATMRRKTAQLASELEEGALPDIMGTVHDIDDDVLRLIFLTCHPALTADARAALALRLLGGLTTAEIARGFLVKEATIGQRISRAKRTLAEVRADFEVPTGPERESRLADVMAVIYLIFNEGYSATAGQDWMRPDLCQEAIRLARLLAELSPRDAEVHGLLALVEIQASRTVARLAPDGTPVLLEDQDRRRWDQVAIRRGLAALNRAQQIGGPVGPYVLQAAIAACHAQADRAEDTNWVRVADLYDLLARATHSPIVEVNRAVAHGRAYGPDAGLEILAPLVDEPRLAVSRLVPAVRGDLLARAGRRAEAAQAFRAAAALAGNDRERALLSDRARQLG